MEAHEKADIKVDGEGQDWLDVATVSTRRRRDGAQNKSECLYMDQHRKCTNNHPRICTAS